jgi:hypothetical protein
MAKMPDWKMELLAEVRQHAASQATHYASMNEPEQADEWTRIAVTCTDDDLATVISPTYTLDGALKKLRAAMNADSTLAYAARLHQLRVQHGWVAPDAKVVA